MLGIQLSSLSVPELRRLLEAARTRGQEPLARQLEAELAARSGQPAGGPPLPMTSALRPAPRLEPPAVRSRGPTVAVAALAAFIGAALAWSVSREAPRPSKPQPVALAAAPPAPRIAVALAAAPLPEEALTQPVEEPAAPALDPPEPKHRAARNPCLDLPTAHERLVCGYPSLARQDRRMKAALERARAASGDPGAFDGEQAAWRRASADISDRLALGDRYAERIAELEAEAPPEPAE